jgi:putative ABC transport system substrate-binding protein
LPALKGAATSIPILFMRGSEPVGSGLVASLNRPGINVTGATMLAGPLEAKRLQLLRELNPKASAVGLLINPNNPNSEPELADLQVAARRRSR